MLQNIICNHDSEKSWLVRGAEFDNDIPIIETAIDTPPSLISFSRRKGVVDFASWICFYEDDDRFSSLWNEPKKYVQCLKRFGGIISPDFSICPDYPWPLQSYNKYRNHALAYWLSTQGIPVIPNVRWGNEYSYKFCFNGIEKNSTVAIGTHGAFKRNDNKKLFLRGLPIMVSTLCPHTIIVYGKAPDDIFGIYEDAGIKIISFPSSTEQYFANRKVDI